MRVLATVVTLLAAPLALARVCRDPCLEAARTSYVECRQGATEELALERQLCRDRDPACVQECAARQEGCSTTTGIGAALEKCLAAQQAAIADCRNRFQRRSRRREQCVDNARIDGFQCRNRARTGTAPERRQCRADFDVCADGCGPGEPPRGAPVCQRDARRARSAALLACDRTATADKSACTNKDAACAESCRDAGTACDEPGRDAFASAVAACDVARGQPRRRARRPIQPAATRSTPASRPPTPTRSCAATRRARGRPPRSRRACSSTWAASGPVRPPEERVENVQAMGLGGAALGSLAKLPINTQLQAFFSEVLTPAFGPDSQPGFQVQFSFAR